MMRAYEFVTNTPVTLDEHRGYLADDVSLVRTSPPLSPPIKAQILDRFRVDALITVLAGAGMIERCVVVQRQHDGYGFTVTGDHPVFVHTVKLEGAAFCAGVREGDRILKVNGMPVTSNNHLDVVRMISGGQNVVLTLLGAPPEPLGSYMIPDSKNDSKFNITDSVFTDGATKDEWKKKRKEILSQMLDEERRHVEGLRETSENGDKLDRALKRIVSLQSQLRHIKPAEPIWNQQSVPMDGDTDEDETECLPIDNHGLFSNLAEMKTHPAHLAVFINYLLSNANPSSLVRKNLHILATTAEHISDSDVEILKRVFVPGRQRAVADINEHMADFRQKRQLGLGSIFDANQLAHLVRGDRAMETRKITLHFFQVGEQLMFRSLDNIIGSISELDACEMQMRTQAIIASLSTVIRIVLGSKPSTTAWEKMMERCPQFLIKEKGGKGRKPPSNLKSKAQIKGHMFIINPVNTVHYCYQCRDAIWGMQPWCYFCNNCDVKVHAYCTSSLTDACYPATQSKQKSKTRKSGLVGKSDAEEDEPPRPEHNVKSTSSDSGIGQEIHEKPVGRSHSMRNRATIPQHVDDRVTKRDRSTPSWGSDLPPADEEEEGGRRNRSIDGRSEARSLEGSRLVIDLQSISGSSSISHASIAEDEVKRMWERMQTSAISEGDSDMEVETEAPSLDQIVDWDIIRHLKPKEKKRQEVINELFHTERTHVRNLKILLNVFYKPMLANNIVSPDVVHLLFANLDEVLEIHIEMCAKMRRSVEQWRRENNHGLYGNIGELMEGMFDGEAGEKLMQVTSMFCQHQQHALDILRARCKKDKEDGLVKFLADAEANPLCRKLQLKDMIPVEMQRLVKYPLLIETIAKYTNEKGEVSNFLRLVGEKIKRIAKICGNYVCFLHFRSKTVFCVQ
uniref:PDZ domain-containing protein n=1 Tax=Heterorhabditis bacteriophora TaxID=37862 RepID=A0A1I7WXK8_HETBA